MSKSLLRKPGFLFQKIGGKLSYIISRRLHWMAQWAGAQVAATTVWLTSNRQLEGTIGRVADMAHTGSFITRRGHLNILWIHIALSTPMSIPSAMVKYGESQDNSSSRLKTRGLQWYGSIKLAGFNGFKNSGSLEGR